MAMRLVPQPGQRLVMIPLLQQAIQSRRWRPTLELKPVMRKQFAENPFVEAIPEEQKELDGEARVIIQVFDHIPG